MGAAIRNGSPEGHRLKHSRVHKALSTVQDWPPSNLHAQPWASACAWTLILHYSVTSSHADSTNRRHTLNALSHRQCIYRTGQASSGYMV